jgi:hypothetical protein
MERVLDLNMILQGRFEMALTQIVHVNREIEWRRLESIRIFVNFISRCVVNICDC